MPNAESGAIRSDRDRVRNAVHQAVARWRQNPRVVVSSATTLTRSQDPDVARESIRETVDHARSKPGVFARLPRREFLEVRPGEAAPPKIRVMEFRLSRIKALRRLFVWLSIGLAFAAGVCWDWARRRNTPAQRAVRLRRIFARAGGTFIKVGQYLAMRLDLLPWDYGLELSRLLDRMPPFPSDKAIAMIERATRRPLADTFDRFDPEAVRSSATSCVYQAFLRTGQKVVVKVRRPGMGELFTADLKAFEWLARVLEFITFLRPGRTENMVSELRDTLLGELDFIQAARQQDSFRRAARKSGKRFFTAPRVYFDLSNEEVLTQEFVGGMWLWELLAAVEQNDEKILTLARELEIDCGQIARRLSWVSYWGWHEHLFFRADPHPDGVIIGAGGKLTFIDFSSVDAINRTKRRALRQNMYYARKRDPINMARASLVLLEPLPPVDVIGLVKDLEAHNWEMLYAFESPPSRKNWAERTFARQWIGVFQLARRLGITIEFSILRLLRMNVLYDTMVVRLDPEVDVIAEYRRFASFQARRAQERGFRRVTRPLWGGVDNRIFLKLERLAGIGEGLLFRLRQVLVMPRAQFSALMSKWSFLAYTIIMTSGQLLLVTALAAGAVAARQYVDTAHVTAGTALQQVVAQRTYQWLVVAILFLNGRRLRFRMDEKEV